jgi:hypothetical protein
MDECPVDRAMDYCYLKNDVAADEDVGGSECEKCLVAGDSVMDECSIDKAMDYSYLKNTIAADGDVGGSEGE